MSTQYKQGGRNKHLKCPNYAFFEVVDYWYYWWLSWFLTFTSASHLLLFRWVWVIVFCERSVFEAENDLVFVRCIKSENCRLQAAVCSLPVFPARFSIFSKQFSQETETLIFSRIPNFGNKKFPIFLSYSCPDRPIWLKSGHNFYLRTKHHLSERKKFSF